MGVLLRSQTEVNTGRWERAKESECVKRSQDGSISSISSPPPLPRACCRARAYLVMSLNLEVVLEPEKSCYTNGEDVTGWVNVKVETVTACRAILARARGFCEVRWESSSDDDDVVTDTETFFDHTITVWSGASYGENLMPGEFRFPFCFKLPDKLPPTYEGKYGHIRYSVEAQNDFQWGAVEKAIARFKVKPLQDLNEDPKLAESLPLRKEEMVCCLCCEEGPVMVSLTAEKGGYVAGEYVLITGEVTNRTSKVVESANIQLLQTITFYAKGNTKKQKNLLKEVHKPGFGAGGTDVWLSVPIRVPEYAVSIDHCHNISVEYKIRVAFSVGGYWDVDVENTFRVGTIPVGKVAFALDGDPSSNTQPSAPPLEDPITPPLPILEQPRALPAPTDPLAKEGKEGDGCDLPVS
uniref:Arrestin C-terminal-like domain-containing protein n=1 Tax=Scylla olivacea TaxID=85551 RepID=A0A0P4W0C0_SCYOL